MFQGLFDFIRSIRGINWRPVIIISLLFIAIFYGGTIVSKTARWITRFLETSFFNIERFFIRLVHNPDLFSLVKLSLILIFITIFINHVTNTRERQ